MFPMFETPTPEMVRMAKSGQPLRAMKEWRAMDHRLNGVQVFPTFKTAKAMLYVMQNDAFGENWSHIPVIMTNKNTLVRPPKPEYRHLVEDLTLE